MKPNNCATTPNDPCNNPCQSECYEGITSTNCIIYNGDALNCLDTPLTTASPLNDIIEGLAAAICALEVSPETLCEQLAAVSIDCLDDVDTTGAVNGNFFKFVTDTWIPTDIVIADISDIVLTSPADGDVLQFNGTNWVNVSNDCSIQYTQAGIVAAAGANTLLDACEVKLYDTTNYNSVSLSTARWNIGAIFSVLTSNKFSLIGNAGYYIPDYSGTDTNYNDGVIFAQTGVHPTGDALGIWNSTLLPVIGDCCVWGGFNWINVNGNVGAATDQFTLNGEWIKLTKTVSTALSKGYRDKIDMIKISFSYSTGVVTLLERKDNLGNVVQGENNILRFPWGNPNITNCFIDSAVTLDTTMINELDTINAKVCMSGYSNFFKSIDLSDTAYYTPATDTIILTTYPHVGIIELVDNVGEPIDEFTGFPQNHTVRFTSPLGGTSFVDGVEFINKGSINFNFASVYDFIDYKYESAIALEQNQGKY